MRLSLFAATCRFVGYRTAQRSAGGRRRLPPALRERSPPVATRRCGPNRPAQASAGAGPTETTAVATYDTAFGTWPTR
ncbi:hypothetical protein SALB1_2499 [Salinisphaera sp. LB1]|nr:hypothetical protein SALB1_2499 [Salinisphaera sp. LB1]